MVAQRYCELCGETFEIGGKRGRPRITVSFVSRMAGRCEGAASDAYEAAPAAAAVLEDWGPPDVG